MAKRFSVPAIPKGEVAQYSTNPYQQEIIQLGMFGKDSDSIMRPNDDLLLQKGGTDAFPIYTKLLFDETVQASLIKMSQEITAREWKIEPASEKAGDIAVKDFVEEKLHSLQMDEIYRGLLESYIVGFSVGEIMWRRTASGIIPFDFRFRDQRRFRFQEEEDADYGFTMRMVTRDDRFTGIELPPRKFVVHRYWAQNNGDPYGAGLGRVLYPLVKFKRRALESQLLYSDRFSNPTAVAKAPLSATAAEIDTLYNHLSNLSQETALVLPEGFELEFVNPGGSPDTFQNLRETLAQSIHILVAGEDEAGNADAGSRASSEVAQTVRTSRAHDLSELISQTLNESMIRWIVELNFGTSVTPPKIYRDFAPKENVQLSMADVATLVKDVGLRPTVEWITDRFDVEIEEEETQIPQGPEGTSGVDTTPEEKPEGEAKKEEGDKKKEEGDKKKQEGDKKKESGETTAGDDEMSDEDIDKLIAEILKE